MELERVAPVRDSEDCFPPLQKHFTVSPTRVDVVKLSNFLFYDQLC